MDDERFKDRVGFPNQEDIPYEYRNNKANFYPKIAGIGQYIDKISEILLAAGVEILTSSKIQDLNIGPNDEIHSCSVINNNGQNQEIDCDFMIWTAPLIFLKPLMSKAEIDDSWMKIGKPPSRALQFVHFTTIEPLFNSSAFYYYDFSQDSSFRITNYSAFTSHPLGNAYTLEFIEDFKKETLEHKSAMQMVNQFLKNNLNSNLEASQIFIDPLRVPVPDFHVRRYNTLAEKHTCPIKNLHLYGSSASQSFQLSRNIYATASDLTESIL